MSKILYELIQSLSTSEKVYFKRSAKIHAAKEGKNYLKIYDALEKLDTYDQSTFTSQFKGTTINKYLSSEINYLKEKILISLFHFNMNRSKRNQIQKGIFTVEALASKGFQKEALKKLKIIKKSAIKHEEFTWVLRLIELEEMVLFKEGIIGYKDDLKQLQQQRNDITSKIQNINEYHILRQEIRELQFNEHLLTYDNNLFNDLNDNPLISDRKNCMSTKAKEHWYYIQVLMSYLKRDFNKGLSISSEYVKFMYQNKGLFDNSKTLPALSNYIYHAALTKNNPHFELGKKLLTELANKNEVPQPYFRYILYTRNLEFSYYTNDKRLMEEYTTLASGLIEQEEEHFEESQIQYLFMVVVRSAIVLKKHDLGIYYCNLWHQRGVLTFRKVQFMLFSLMIYFELKYFELIQSELILLKKMEKKDSREKILINIYYSFMNLIIKHPEKKDTLISKFQKELKSISINKKNYFDFISFDYYQWSLRLN